MKTIALNLYSFSELNEKAREKALAELSDINVDYDWWDFAYDDFIAIAETIGIKIDPKKIYFRGFYSQGDGSCFSASVDVAQMIPAIQHENWKSYAPNIELNLPVPQLDARVLKLIAGEQLDISPTIEHNSRYYCVSASLNEQLPYSNHRYPQIEAQLEKLGTDLQAIADRLNRYLFKALEEEYEYLCSEKAVIETIEANEYWFTADGKLATRVDRLANNELLNA